MEWMGEWMAPSTEWRKAHSLASASPSTLPRNGTGSEDPSDLSLCRMWGLVTLEVRGVDAG